MDIQVNKRKLQATQAAEVLKKVLSGRVEHLTIADAATKSGLSLTEAERGLHFLVNEYRGQLSATSQGELLFRFPHGFHKPWEKEDAVKAFLEKCGRFGLGVLKFLVRAWISIVMVGYVAIFAIILIALTFSKSSDRDEDSPSLGSSLMLHALMRLVIDSLFWTFHPFSPFAITYQDPYGAYRPKQKKVPFYERVNRLFFGPEPKKTDPEALTRAVLQEIRAQKGRIGLFDVMRVTGLSKDLADPLMARLMLDYEGEVSVSPEGGIYYEFPALRKTALENPEAPAEPVWNKKEVLPPFTGNPAGSNAFILLLNGFNLLMSTVAIANSWTIEKLRYIFEAAASRIPPHMLPPPPEGVPLVLGYIPFAFSAALFALPLIRLWHRQRKRHQVQRKNGQKGILRALLTQLSPNGIKESLLKENWAKNAGAPPSESELTREIVKLGGELEIQKDGTTVYRFPDLEAELGALKNARAIASDEEKKVGEVVFRAY